MKRSLKNDKKNESNRRRISLIILLILVMILLIVVFSYSTKTSNRRSNQPINEEIPLELINFLESKNIDPYEFLVDLQEDTDCNGLDWGPCLEKISKVLEKYKLKINYGICLDRLNECRPEKSIKDSCLRTVFAKSTEYVIYLCI
ncbi:MAG: hypothetical protein QXD62_01595 [Candidatus Woesearchaeota archaeon]